VGVNRDVTVCVATFGADTWKLVAERAVASAVDQASVIYVHGETLADARNRALTRVRTQWVVFLDADDELEAGYIDTLHAGRADVRAPAVRYIQGARCREPYVPVVPGHEHGCGPECLRAGNWIVVGALARTQLVRDVGGWGDEELYEDWALWLRCQLAGATFEAIPDAVYRAHVRVDSRNRAPSLRARAFWHDKIARQHLGAAS
jgi:cellulose synthase/poly-beta-1,6-N-acetylglucosamine synthase-like glycosyltransferase